MAKEEKKKEEPEKPVASAPIDPIDPTDPIDPKKNASDGEKATDANPEAKPASEAKPAEHEASGSAPAPSPEPDWKDLYARLRADFDNFKKRTARDREETYRYAEADILKDVLPAVDNLALALANAADAGSSPRQPADAESSPRQNKDGSSANGRGEGAASTSAEHGEGAASTSAGRGGDAASAAFVKGVQLVYDALLKSLKDHGAEPFDSVGQALDTERMEAIATLPSATVEEGKVSNEVKRGWMLKGKVLRVAQVVVSSGKPA